MPASSLEQIVNLCKRRGFIFPGSEIYGGLANTWDYGPYGVELKNNLKQFWWKYWVTSRDDIVGLDSAILMNPKTWEASGHVANFSDPLVDCRKCKTRYRGDKLIEESWFRNTGQSLTIQQIKKVVEKNNMDEIFFHEYESTNKIKSIKDIENLIKRIKKDWIDNDGFIFTFLTSSDIRCPNCDNNDWTRPKKFNLMFKTHQGVTEETGADVYLRPETAQGIFVNFKNIVNSTRVRLPFGVAQIGKAFRNEITPGNFTFRTREFEQMEIEYFCHEKNWRDVYAELEEASLNFFLTLGIKKENLRWRTHEKDELSHYSSLTKDMEYKFPWGLGELEGLAYRGNFDLTQHQKFSGESMEYLDPVTNEKFVPHCVEPSFGCDRSILTILLDAYDEDEIGGEKRVVMRFAPAVAPIKVAILPLSKKEQLSKEARRVQDFLNPRDFSGGLRTEYDETQSIGRRYRRQDEIGTPLCVTVDFGSIGEEATGQCQKGHVTLRDRDTTKQEEVKIENVPAYVKEKLAVN